MTIKADYITAEKTAKKLLEVHEIDALPVDLECLFNSFPDLQIKSYSWFAEKSGITIDEVISYADSDSGCCFYMPEHKRYLILYNDTIPNEGHIRWTIAHELGHYLLKHNEKSDRTALSRNSLSVKEYTVFEKEANCFARSLLAPPSVLVAMGRLDVIAISHLCLISNAAAQNVLNFINKGLEMGKLFRDNLTKIFKRTIYNHVNAHSCLECLAVFSNEYCNYCPICGSEEILKGKRYNNMIYPGHATDNDGRVKICARCQNEEISNDGDFCKICAAPTVNKCTNAHYDLNGYIEWECNTIASGNARFCVRCGSETIFYKEGMLKSWEEENPRFDGLKAVL